MTAGVRRIRRESRTFHISGCIGLGMKETPELGVAQVVGADYEERVVAREEEKLVRGIEAQVSCLEPSSVLSSGSKLGGLHVVGAESLEDGGVGEEGVGPPAVDGADLGEVLDEKP